MDDHADGPDRSTGTATATITRAAPTLWHNSAYLLLMSGRTTQLIGAGIGAFAIPLIAYRLTGSVAQAGLIAAIGEIGALIATLPAGVVADRVDRRRLIMAATGIGALLWTTAAIAGAIGELTAWLLAAVLFGSSVVSAFANPAESGGIRAVVTSEQLPSAMAAMQGRSAVASLIAGPAGGFLYGLGHVVPILASAIGHALVAITTGFVRRPLNPELDDDTPAHPLRSLLEGLQYVWSVPLFRICIGLFVMINITVTGMLVAINLELVRTGTPPVLIGMIDLAAGVALITGSIAAPGLLKRFRVGPVTVLALAVLAVCSVGMAIVHAYWGYLVLVMIPLFLAPAVNAGVGGYASAITPDRLQGRLNSVLGLTGLLAAPIAPIAGSLLLAGFGIVRALWVLAIALVLTVIWLCLVRSLWRVGRPDSWEADKIDWPPTPTPESPTGS